MKLVVVYTIKKEMEINMGQFQEKTIISIVGLTNVGKSTLFNAITGQKNKAIVDSKAGTTADNVISLMEIHGLGKVKLIDTAGIDEEGELGNKKREKTKQAIAESDLILFVIKNDEKELKDYEKNILNFIKEKNKNILIIYNKFNDEKINIKIDDIKFIELNLNQENQQLKITDFILENYKKNNNSVNLLPDLKLKDSYVLLVIPLDEESPELRLLRPQSLMIERLLQNYAIPVLYRPNLKNFDKDDFIKNIQDLKNTDRELSLIITDSQAINVIYDCIPQNINFTSFSIIMSNFMSNGKLINFINGARELDNIKDNDNILIVEACNHDRKCNDIATVQLPNAIKKYTQKNVNFDFNFGQTFLAEEEIKNKNYKLVIICGGCMIDKQKYQARLEMLEELKIPTSNYGIIFSYIKNKKILEDTAKIFN